MTDLRTAAQQALEALQNCANGEDDVMLTRDALANLRAALAEPVQEPVAWLSRDDARLALWEAINKREFGNPTDDKLILNHLHQQGLWIGKYTSPPQRKPLTEEEIYSLFRTAASPVMFARAIERAHGVGGDE